MDFGIVLQNDPPAGRIIEFAMQAELFGFSHVWTFDSHLLWQEPYVIYSRILGCTHTVTVGPMVTNPATRDPTVTASLFATLNDLYGNRTICGIGRGDSAVRVINGKPATLAVLQESISVIGALANGQPVHYRGATLQLGWSAGSRLPIWVAGYGPKTLALTGRIADGFILQLADPAIAAWSIHAVRAAAADAGRDPDAIAFCVAAPAYVTDGSAEQLGHAREQCRWFGGMVGNHAADLVARYGAGGSAIPAALSDFVARRGRYDYRSHGRSGHAHTDYVDDDVVDRFCLLGPIPRQLERLRELQALGVTQFALYLQHDAKAATLASYGHHVIPAMNPRGSDAVPAPAPLQ